MNPSQSICKVIVRSQSIESDTSTTSTGAGKLEIRSTEWLGESEAVSETQTLSGTSVASKGYVVVDIREFKGESGGERDTQGDKGPVEDCSAVGLFSKGGTVSLGEKVVGREASPRELGE